MKKRVKLEYIYLYDALMYRSVIISYFTTMQYKKMECVFLLNIYKHVH